MKFIPSIASLALLLWGGTNRALPQQPPPPQRPPIIDMHLHALNVADFGPSPAACSDNRGIVWNGWDPAKPFSLGEAGSCAASSCGLHPKVIRSC
jgi:hypothetical protein